MDSDHYLETVHAIVLLADSYEVGVQRRQLFLANRRAQLDPFFDEVVLRVGFAFHPDVRYQRAFQSKHLLKNLLEPRTGFDAGRKPKGLSILEDAWYEWMRSGPLRPLVADIERPAFVSRPEYEQLVERPSYFLRVLLVLDIFRKRVLEAHSRTLQYQ